MKQRSTSINYEYLIIILTGFLVSIFLTDQLWFFIFAILIVTLLLRYGEKFVIVFGFVSLVTITRSFAPDIRLFIQLFNILLLGYFFTLKYQFDFKKYPRIPKPLIYLILSLFLSMILSVVFSKYFILGLEQISRTALFFLILYLFYGLIKSDKDLNLYTNTFMVAGVILFFLVLNLFITSDLNLIRFQQKLLFSETDTFIHKNGIAAIMMLAISILTAKYFDKAQKKNKTKIIITIILFSIVLLISNSRGAIIALVISTMFILFVINKKALLKFVAYIVAVFLIFLIEPMSSFLELYFRVDQVFTGRDIITEAIDIVISNNFIFGTGPGGVKYEIYKNIPVMFGSTDWFFLERHIESITYGHAHNFYLFFLSELGVLGFLNSLAFPVVFFYLGYKTIKKVRKLNNSLYILLIGIMAAGISIFIRGIFEWGGILSYGAIAADLPFWWWIVCMAYISSKYSNQNYILSIT